MSRWFVPKEIHVHGWDLDGNEITLEADELLSRLIPTRARSPARRVDVRSARGRSAQGGADRIPAAPGSAAGAEPSRRRSAASALVTSPMGAPWCARAGAGVSSTSRLPRHTRDGRADRFGPWSPPASTLPLVISRVDKRRGRGSELSPSPVKAAAIELGLPVSPLSRRSARCRRRPRCRRRLWSADQASRARATADDQYPLLVAAALARRRARRACPARRRCARPAPV